MISRLQVEYCGQNFAGWAAQPQLRTVQGVLEAALDRLLGSSGAQPTQRRLSVAGRTDRGVHAWGQVASYPGEPLSPARINTLLPEDLSVLDCAIAPAGFDARRWARSRRYCYRVLVRRTPPGLLSGRALWWPRELDRELLNSCAAAVIGVHNFKAFTPTVTEHVHFDREVLDCCWREQGDLLEFWIEAGTFMRHMNRVLVGTMLEVASGRRDPAGFECLLQGASRDQAGPTAPAHGLALASVRFAADGPPERGCSRLPDAHDGGDDAGQECRL